MLHEIEEADLRDRIEQVVEEYPRYGYRRVTHHLRREGFKVNHKRVSRIMREESLQCGVNPIGWTVTGLKLECPPGWLN